jgi:hypothetical protein
MPAALKKESPMSFSAEERIYFCRTRCAAVIFNGGDIGCTFAKAFLLSLTKMLRSLN